MTPEQLYQKLEYADKYRENRQKVADIILQEKALMPVLLQVCYRFDDETSRKACWTLEFVCKRKLPWLLPFLDDFIPNLPKFKFDATVRPMAKIAQLLVNAYFSKKFSPVKDQLTETHLEQLAEINFDWLISNEKVAVKAYAIHSLYDLGKKWDWIYPELKVILEQNMHKYSAAYKAAARNTLKKLS
ncbi:MAG: adenylosuccinate lyase [Bacteroidota bacterium]